MDKGHTPVLYHEAMEALSVTKDGLYFDATYGRGGHSRAILAKLGQAGRLCVFDQDPDAICHAQAWQQTDARIRVISGPFTQMQTLAEEQGVVASVSGILMDLGVSSPQLDEAERGFSFLREGPLDMRMDPTRGMSAEAWLQQVSQQQLQDALKRYGEERFARRIAQAIIKARADTRIKTTTALAAIIAAAHPKWEKGKHPATRSFQGIRIAINQELEVLPEALVQALHVLKPGGRLVVISFHSLEDGIVKRFIQKEAKGDIWPEGLPVTADMINPTLKKIGKAVRAGQQELGENPRARSAIMRIAEKL